MRRVFILLFFFSYLSYSQNKQILFGFSEIPQSIQINPGGKINNHWYVGIPLLSHIHVNTGFSGVSAYDVFADDNRDFNDRLRSVVYSLSNTDFFAVNQQVEIFSGGFSYGKGVEKDTYWSFGLYQETDFFLYFPKEYALLAYEGNADNIGKPFDLSDLNVSAELISVLHLGYNKKLNEKLTVGLRGKIYSSIINVNSTKNSGTFTTREGPNNFYEHEFNLGLALRTSGAKSLLNDDNSDFSSDLKTLRKRILFGGNLGLGIDAGFTYNFTDRLSLEASIQDLGFIRHSKDIENYELNNAFTFEGVNPIFPEAGEAQTADEYWEEVSENFEDLFELDTTNTKYTTWRPTKLHTALRYAFGKKIDKDCNCVAPEGDYLNAIGAQLFIINRPKQPNAALTAFYYRQLFSGLRVKTTYTIDSFSYKNVGLGLSAHLGNVNFYAMVDNLLEFQNLAKTQSVSLQFGFNLIFDEKK